MTDLIDRQMVMEVLNAIYINRPLDSDRWVIGDITNQIKDLPSAEPERKKGKWISCTKQGMPLTELGRMKGEKWYGYKCSMCNFIYKGNALLECDYCQHCGADMRGEEE